MVSGEGGGGNSQWRIGIHVPPRVIGKIKKIALVIGKNKKNLDILPLKRVKFEIFARVVALIKKDQ